VIWKEGESLSEESPELRHWRLETTKALGISRVFKFTGKYWIQWKGCVVSALQSVRLEHLLWNNFQLDVKSSQGDAQQFHAAQTIVRNFLYDHMNTEHISDLNGCTGVFAIWKRLRDTYENRGLNQWTSVFENWSSHSQGNLPMEQYIREEEEFVERLKSLGKTFGNDLDDLRVHFFMKGLHSRYETQAAVYKFMEKPYEFYVSEFRSLSFQKEQKRSSRPEANASAHGGGDKNRDRKGGFLPKIKRCFKCGETGHLPSVCTVALPLDDNKNPMPLCFFCKAHGHLANACPKRAGPPSTPK
jgi:hypothetical protein